MIFSCPPKIQPPPAFENATWADVIKYLQTGAVPDDWTVGKSKTMDIGGKSYLIDIIGKNHDTYASGGTAPLTFQFHELYADLMAMNIRDTNKGGYGLSEMHTTNLPSIKNMMPDEVKTSIKQVKKKTGLGNGSTSGTEEVACELFLLSEIEVFGQTFFSVEGEGSQYEYYKQGGQKAKLQNGIWKDAWERSPRTRNTGHFCYININGNGVAQTSSAKLGVAPAFCF